jgi:hypothetical protein
LADLLEPQNQQEAERDEETGSMQQENKSMSKLSLQLGRFRAQNGTSTANFNSRSAPG